MFLDVAGYRCSTDGERRPLPQSIWTASDTRRVRRKGQNSPPGCEGLQQRFQAEKRFVTSPPRHQTQAFRLERALPNPRYSATCSEGGGQIITIGPGGGLTSR